MHAWRLLMAACRHLPMHGILFSTCRHYIPHSACAIDFKKGGKLARKGAPRL